MSRKLKFGQREITGLWMALIFIPLLIVGGYFFFSGIVIIGTIGTYELVRMHNHSRGLSLRYNFIAPVLSFILDIILMLFCLSNVYSRLNLIVFTLLLFFIFLLALPLFDDNLKITDGFYYLGSILYAGLGVGILGIIRCNYFRVDNPLFIGSLDVNIGSFAIFAYMVVCTVCTDIFAYVTGILFGKHKLIPQVSPKKTIEGSIGGSIVGTICGTITLTVLESLIGFSLFGFTNLFVKILVTFFISLLITIIAQFGDLIASKLKREYGIKDYGKVFPGHGGIMDRFDSLIFTGLILFVLLAIFGVFL